MAVQKIVYITPGERNWNGLTHSAKSQLRSLVKNVLEKDTWEKLVKVFRSIENASGVFDSLTYLVDRTNKIVNAGEENLYTTFISDPKDVENIVASTKQWEVVVVGVERNKLKDIMGELQRSGYNGYREFKDMMNHVYNVYAYTIDLEHKDQSEFFVAKYGE